MNDNRLCRDPGKDFPEYVNQFFEDYDRIIFCQPFRRLHDKTQVHPLSTNDYVRSRLIHSLEVATIGQYLGTSIGDDIINKFKIPAGVTKETFGLIVQAACLAHDIGNPPFGHCGEDAFREFYKHGNQEILDFIDKLEDHEKYDLLNFEGNAQGFRILTQIENNKWNGGLQLTFSTLATFMKYPWDINLNPRNKPKFSFYFTERKYAEVIANEVGLIQLSKDKTYWCRHPLAYLVEAADDICYTIIDLEDGKEMKCMTFDEYEEILIHFVEEKDKRFYFDELMDEGQKTSFLRSKAILSLSKQVRSIFINHVDEIMNGIFEGSLLDKIEDKDIIEKSNSIFKNRILKQSHLLELEVSSYRVIGELLLAFVDACIKFHEGKISARQDRLIKLMGIYAPNEQLSPYENLMRVHDYVSGMTDRYALGCYRKLQGITSTRYI